MMRGTGWLPDLRYGRPEALLFGSLPIGTVGVGDLRPFYVDPTDQVQTEACTGFAVQRAEELVHRANRKAEELVVVPRPSALGLYTGGRRWSWREAPRAVWPPLADRGARLQDVFSWMGEYGWAPEESWPFSSSETELDAPVPARHGAYGARGQRWYRIAGYGAARLVEVRRALAAMMPVVIGAFIGADWDNGRRVLEPPDPNGIRGGHAVCLLAEDDGWWFANSWGAGWGENGLGRMSEEYLAGAMVPDVIVLSAAPWRPT